MKRLRWMVVLACLGLVFPACGEKDEKDDSTGSELGGEGQPGGDANHEEPPTTGGATNNNNHEPDDPGEGDNHEHENSDYWEDYPRESAYDLPNRLDFGPIEAGSSQTLSLELKAFGDEPIHIESIVIEGDAFSFVLPDPEVVWPIELHDGESLVMDVIFSPEANREHSGEMRFKTDADRNPNREVVLMGNRSCGELEPGLLRFDDVPIGEIRKGTFTFTNCSDLVEIEVIEVDFSAGPDHYHSEFVADVDYEVPFVLAPGEVFGYPVVFAPAEAGQHAGHFTIGTNTKTGTSSQVGYYGARVAGFTE